MVYVEFYQFSTGYPSYTEKDIKPIPACGMDSVFILDGRLSILNMIRKAREIALKRKFIGFTINRGESFTRSRAITKYMAA